jgi:ligand-binding sensor domain-containing protein
MAARSVEDARGTLWIRAAQQGVIRYSLRPMATSGRVRRQDRFDLATHTTHVYTDKDGMASCALSCLLEDSNGDLWMSTTEGVSRLTIQNGRFRNYSVEDGLHRKRVTTTIREPHPAGSVHRQ